MVGAEHSIEQLWEAISSLVLCFLKKKKKKRCSFRKAIQTVIICVTTYGPEEETRRVNAGALGGPQASPFFVQCPYRKAVEWAWLRRDEEVL